VLLSRPLRSDPGARDQNWAVTLEVFDFLRKILANDPVEKPPATGGFSRELKSVTRKSNGLKHFFDVLPDREHLDILDLGGLNQENIGILSQFGGTVHAVDLLVQYDQRMRDHPESSMDIAAARDFVDEYLNFPRNQFDAILAWDSLEFLDSDVVHLAVARLEEVLRPGGGMLTFFHTQGRGESVPSCRYRIDGSNDLVLQPRDTRTLPTTFNNRSLERLFVDYESIKFFLTRDSIREVIVSK
jgi:SAM-dependent methyltransferase